MDLKELVVVSSLSGIYKVVNTRKNGLIIEDMKTGKSKFVATRRYNFTPLGTIGIFTDDGETVELKNVFRNMIQQREDNPPISPTSSNEELREYLLDILPNHDQEKVRISDIQKLIRWFNFLDELNYWENDDTNDIDVEGADDTNEEKKD